MPRPRPTKKVSVNVANLNVRGNSTNANMRITRSRYNTINLEDSIAIRNSNTTNVMEIVEDNQFVDNNTINLEDSTAIEVDVETQDDEGGNGGGGDSDVVDLTDGQQDSQAPVSTSMNSRTPRRQLPQAVMANESFLNTLRIY